jgi:hypothetical protein
MILPFFIFGKRARKAMGIPATGHNVIAKTLYLTIEQDGNSFHLLLLNVAKSYYGIHKLF